MIRIRAVLSNSDHPHRRPGRPGPQHRLRWRRRLSALCLAASLPLAGCGGGQPGGVALRDAPAVAQAELVRRDSRLVPPTLVWHLPDGTSLPVRVWPARTRTKQAPRGIVLALHGFNDSRDGWEYGAPALAASGFTVFAPDQEGFGQTADRGRWPGTDRLVEDAAEMVRLAQAAEPGLPVYVIGESMGGAVALCLAARPDHLPVAGFVLLAPAVWSRSEMSPLVRFSLWSADMLDPGWQLTGRALPMHIRASDNLAALYRLSYDPLTLQGARVDVLSGLVDLMSRAASAAGQVHGPVLIAYGAHDQLVPPEATLAAWRRLPPGVRRAYYPSGWHLLTRDLGRQSVLRDVASWMTDASRPLPSGADVAAAAWMAGPAWDRPVPVWLPAGLDGLADGGGGQDGDLH